MKYQSAIVACITFCCLFGLLSADPSMVIEIFRHGARDGKNSPRLNISFPNSGELTPVGMHQHFLLGQALRAKYPNLLTTFDASNILARASDYNRTLMSTYSQVFGVYEGTAGNFDPSYPLNLALPPINIGNVSYNFSAVLPNSSVSIPIQDMELNNDVLLQAGGPACPYADQLLNQNMNNGTLPGEIAQIFNGTLIQLGQIFNVSDFGIQDALALYDALVSCEYNNYSMPGNISLSSDLGKNVSFIYNYVATYAGFGTLQQDQLQSTYLLNDILNKFSSKINGTSNLTFVFYGGHDTTLLPVLGLFNIVTLDCIYKNFFNNSNQPWCVQPLFASHLIFELYLNDSGSGQNTVRLTYNDQPFNACNTTTGNCTFEQFQSFVLQALGPFTPAQYDTVCNRTFGPGPFVVNVPVSLGVKIGVILASILAVMLILAIAWTLIKKKRIESEIPPEHNYMQA